MSVSINGEINRIGLTLSGIEPADGFRISHAVAALVAAAG